MGTRGAIGFRLNQQDKLTYNHFDSYPDCLGEAVVEWVKGVQDWGGVRFLAERLTLVKEGRKPTKAHLRRAEELELIDLKVGNQSTTDYYCILRGAQGGVAKYLEAGFMIENNDFVLNSLFCEYAYIVNLDTMELEFYRGFNTDWGAEGRYARHASKTKTYPDWKGPKDRKGVPTRTVEVPNEYAGVRLVGTCPLNAVPGDWKARFFAEEEA